MAVILGEHQKQAIDSLKSGAILRGGVGSGKSRTALAYYYSKECNGIFPEPGGAEYPVMETPIDLYIITTPKKRDDLEWEFEMLPFLLSTEKEISPVKVTVDSWANIKKYVAVKDAFFIFDEQRAIGSGAWANAFVKIGMHNRWILLSGTPGDRWVDYIPVFVANGFYKNRTEFVNRHVVFSRFVDFPKIDRYLETARLKRLKDSITVVMDFERTAVPHNTWIKTKYSEDDYETVWSKRWNIFENKPIQNISSACYLIRKVVNGDPDRIDKVAELHAKHPKIIVFYNFNYELDILLNYADANAIECAQWNGKKHQPLPEGDSWLYLVQYTAGSEGWNCVTTDTIVFYSQNYSYRVITQSAGRTDRYNTPYKDLYYYHLTSDSPIDKAITRAYDTKKKFNEKDFIRITLKAT